MKLSILIVNWNTRDLVVACVNSILKNPPPFACEIIVVDNHSQDGSADALTALFGHNKQIHVFPQIRNLGFARANNFAYQNSAGEYILLLNPDTEVQPGALEKMTEYLDSHGNAGILGPRLRGPDGTTQPSVRRFPGLWAGGLTLTGLHRLIRPRRYLMDDFDYSREGVVDQVMGAALLTRRSLIERLGLLFDEKFWLWYEEVDFCLRAKNAGYAAVYFPGAAVMHRGAASFAQISIYERKKIAARSLSYYFRKNGNWLQSALIKVMLPTLLFAAKALDWLQKFFKFKVKIHV